MRAVRPVLLLLAVILVGACSATAADQPTAPREALVVSCDELSASGGGAGTILERSVSAAVGETIVISLCSNASTGFAWEEPAIANTAVARLVGRSSVAPTGSAVGQAGMERFTFRVASAGSSEVRFSYSQPWAGGEKGAWTLALTIESA